MEALRYVWALALLTCPCTGLHVLMLPGNMNSHLQYFGRVATALVAEGHDVTMVHASNGRVPPWLTDSEVALISYRTHTKEPYSSSAEVADRLISTRFETSFMKKLQLFSDMAAKVRLGATRECEGMAADDHITQQLAAIKFHIGVADPMCGVCLLSYMYSLDVPYAHLSVMWYGWITYRVPGLPSFTPNSIMGFSDSMTFSQRVLNLLSDSMALLIWYYDPERTPTHYSQLFAPGKPPKTNIDLVREAVLWFTLDDVALSHPKASMPNVISVGDIMGVPADTLPRQYLAILAGTNHSVVFVSFGSYLDRLPPDVMDKFCKAFRQLPYTFIWKSQSARCPHENVIIRDWVPQNDLLAHPKIKLFISHGGLNSLIEAVYHAVPVIFFPIAIDQPINAGIATRKGYGKTMSITDFSVQELIETISNVINDASIKNEITKGSEMMTNKSDTPGSRISFWLEHVVKYGDGHLRSASFELNNMEYIMCDIYLFLLLTIGVLSFVLFCILYFCCKCAYRRFGGSQSAKLKAA